jgi:hypothetical protein
MGGSNLSNRTRESVSLAERIRRRGIVQTGSQEPRPAAESFKSWQTRKLQLSQKMAGGLVPQGNHRLYVDCGPIGRNLYGER